MGLLDLGAKNTADRDAIRAKNQWKILPEDASSAPEAQDACALTLHPPKQPRALSKTQAASPASPPEDLVRRLSALTNHRTLILNVASHILLPAWQQRKIAETLKVGGNRVVMYVELGEDKCLFGHDTFLLDLVNVGCAVGRFLN